MKILTEEELTAKLDFMCPLHPPKEEYSSAWCIPFEYGSNGKGTKISISKARQIIAELKAAVAEAESREMRRYFDEEKARGDRLLTELSKARDELVDAQTEVFALKRKLRMKQRT